MKIASIVQMCHICDLSKSIKGDNLVNMLYIVTVLSQNIAFVMVNKYLKFDGERAA